MLSEEVDIEAAEEGGVEDPKQRGQEEDEAGKAEFGAVEEEETEHGDEEDQGVVAGFDGQFAFLVEPGEGASHGGHEESESDDQEEFGDPVEGFGGKGLGLGEAGVHAEASRFRI